MLCRDIHCNTLYYGLSCSSAVEIKLYAYQWLGTTKGKGTTVNVMLETKEKLLL